MKAIDKIKEKLQDFYESGGSKSCSIIGGPMMRLLLVLVMAAGESLLPMTATAEVIRLKNGNTLNGDVEATSEEEVIVSIPGVGRMTLKKDEIISIEKSSGVETGEEPSTTPLAQKQPADQELRWQKLAVQVLPLVKKEQYVEAASVAQEAFQIAEVLFHPSDYRFFISLDALATVYRLQGRASDAESLYQRALAIAEKSEWHYEVASTLHSLGELYSANGQHTEAEKAYQRALTVFEGAFGADHSMLAAHLHSLGKLYLAQGRYAEAKSLYERSLALYEEQGPNHPTLESVYEGYMQVLKATEEEGRAEALVGKRSENLRSYAAKEASWWELNKRVQTLASTGPYADTVKAAKEALGFAEQNLAPRSPLLATSLDNLAMIYFTDVNVPFHGVYAELLYQRSLELKRKLFGPNDPLVLEAVQKYCGVFRKITVDPAAKDPMGVCGDTLDDIRSKTQ